MKVEFYHVERRLTPQKRRRFKTVIGLLELFFLLIGVGLAGEVAFQILRHCWRYVAEYL